MSLSHELAQVALGAAASPDEDALRTRLLSNLAASVGSQAESCALVASVAGDAGPGSRAFVLAARMHSRTQDDFYPEGRVHPGAVVVPAILAGGDAALLPAMAAGYQVLALISEAYATEAQRRGYRPSGVFGPMGAAAAAGVAMGLEKTALSAAIGIASAMAAGTNQSWVDGSDEWLVEVASAARSGHEAARLAAAGVRSSAEALEGKAGFTAAYFQDADASALRASLADRGDRSRAIAVKVFPVSGIAQVPSILSARLARAAEGETLQRVRVRMTHGELEYPGSQNRGPFASRSDSLMSIPRTVALALIHGRVPYASLLKQPDERELRIMDVVELVPDGSLGETESVVEIEISRGQSLTARGTGSEFLYPSWVDLRGDLEDLATRNDARLTVMEQLAELIDEIPTSGAVSRLLTATWAASKATDCLTIAED